MLHGRGAGKESLRGQKEDEDGKQQQGGVNRERVERGEREVIKERGSKGLFVLLEQVEHGFHRC